MYIKTPRFPIEDNDFSCCYWRPCMCLLQVSSQHPYAEQYIGNPHVMTVDYNNSLEFDSAIREIMRTKVLLAWRSLLFLSIWLLCPEVKSVKSRHRCQEMFCAGSSWNPLHWFGYERWRCCDRCCDRCCKMNTILQNEYNFATSDNKQLFVYIVRWDL